ncbi:MAG: AAA family ATPase, partial [Muribaculaceae bacterium]|nr:AAA family ATPase [Muribaculaceae bacterium]
HADTDLCKELGKVFDDLKVANADAINALYDGKDVVGEVKKGTQLLLPNNLYIWATMNTSDQSLFPIDSAFKRRWDWRYIKIADNGKGYVISVNDKEYDWWQFLQKINEHIGTTTSQEDKKLGYFFAKATKNADGKYIIPAYKFLSKVLFFLYGDVYKDYGFDDDIFKGEDGTPMEFSDYFDEQGHAIEEKIEQFLLNLGLEPKATESEITEIEDAEILESEDAARKTTGRLTVEFPDGTTVKEHSQFDTYLKALQKIGLDKVFPIAAQKQYVRRDEPLISKIQSQRIIDDPQYSYVQSGDYYIIKGIDLPTQINFLKLLSQSLNLGLNVYAE